MVHIPELEESSYAGYLTVNKTYNSNMFFWFFPAQMDPENAPVILWLQGGPEVASTYALFNEHGPYVFDAEQKLAKNPYSWNIKHNVVYIDNPVGTGYSFTDSDDGYARNEVDVGRNLLIALQQFFCLFPELQKNSFFATGSSYGGKYVPAIGHAILQDSYRTDADSKKPKINLKGLVIGGGSTDPIHQYIYSDLLYETGLVDWHGYESQRKYEEKVINCLKQNNFSCAYDVDNDRIDEFLTISGFNSVNNILKTQSRNYTPFYELIQKPSTRCAIHVGNNTFYDIILDYNDSNEIKAYNYLILDYMASVADWVCELLPHYPFLLYTGQFDLNVPYHGVENYVKHLNCAGVEAYDKAERIIWRVDGDIAGYVKQVANLTDCMVRNAGKFDGIGIFEIIFPYEIFCEFFLLKRTRCYC